MSRQDPPSDDAALLECFAAERSGQAFTLLAKRHTGLVLDVALRITRSRPLAEEVTQNVFLRLAQKASRVAKTRAVAGWLHRAAVLESRAVLRSESRRLKHLAEAAAMMPDVTPPLPPPLQDSRLTELIRSLDEALESLPEAEREVLLQHYYSRRSYAEAGGLLGTSEAGARQLAARARRRLAAWFGRRGKTVSESVLSTVLAGHFAAPSSEAALAAKVTRAALSAPAAASPLVTGALQALAAGKLPAPLCLLGGFLLTFLTGAGGREREISTAQHMMASSASPAKAAFAGHVKISGVSAGLTEGFDLSQFERELTAAVRLTAERRLGFHARAESAIGLVEGFDLSYGRQLPLARIILHQPVRRMEEILDVCRRADPDGRCRTVVEALFARWAEEDPSAARAAMLLLSRRAQNHAVRGMCSTLINRDVTAAAHEALHIPVRVKGDYFDGSRIGMIDGILNACALRDPEATLAACLDAPEFLTPQRIATVLEGWTKKDPEASAAWLMRTRAAREIQGNGRAETACMRVLMESRPDLAVAVVESIPDGELREALAALLNGGPAGR